MIFDLLFHSMMAYSVMIGLIRKKRVQTLLYVKTSERPYIHIPQLTLRPFDNFENLTKAQLSSKIIYSLCQWLCIFSNTIYTMNIFSPKLVSFLHLFPSEILSLPEILVRHNESIYGCIYQLLGNIKEFKKQFFNPKLVCQNCRFQFSPFLL